MSKTKEVNDAKEQAKAQLESILEMVAALEAADKDQNTNEDTTDAEGSDYEQAKDTIENSPLSVEVRSDWHEVGAEKPEITQFRILLCTGGPAVQIVGDLGRFNQPENARLEYQDWGTPWTEYRDMTAEQKEKLELYCQQFYFGE